MKTFTPGAPPSRTLAAALAVLAVGLTGLLIDALAGGAATSASAPLEANAEVSARGTPGARS